MNKASKNQLAVAFRLFKTGLMAVALLLVLRFAGEWDGLTLTTPSTLMRSGMLDPGAASEAMAAGFDYDFKIKDLQGNEVDVNRFKGNVIFLNMWATWCGPCRAEMPSIQSLYNTVSHDSSIVFVMLSVDKPENRNKVISYVQDKKFDFPVYMLSGTLPALLQVPSIPTTFVIGKDGKVKTKKVGTTQYDTDKFKKFLRSLTHDAKP